MEAIDWVNGKLWKISMIEEMEILDKELSLGYNVVVH